ncbi:MAG: NADH-quinone oxidoreductase subunit A [Acidimicrobiales bacterium]|nr:NADH-quinone oxidoreductase subunit A [Acidimicrobiales bacterium]
MDQYLPILLMLVLAVAFAGISIVVSRVLAPRLSTVAKESPYECGITDAKEAPERFPVTFFLVAMIFIVFDIEVIFLVPWSLVLEELGPFGIGAILIFAAAVFESFVYLIGNGALDWGPVKRVRPGPVVSPSRTAASTVRRVGLEGRGAAAREEAA